MLEFLKLVTLQSKTISANNCFPTLGTQTFLTYGWLQQSLVGNLYYSKMLSTHKAFKINKVVFTESKCTTCTEVLFVF